MIFMTGFVEITGNEREGVRLLMVYLHHIEIPKLNYIFTQLLFSRLRKKPILALKQKVDVRFHLRT